MRCLFLLLLTISIGVGAYAQPAESTAIGEPETDPGSGAEVRLLGGDERPADNIYGEQPYGDATGRRIAIRHYPLPRKAGGINILDLRDGANREILSGKPPFPAFHAWGEWLYDNQQWSHAHPYLTADNKWLVFAARRKGHPQVYGAKLKDGWLADLAGGEILIYRPPTPPAPKPGGIIMFGDSTTAQRPGAVDKVYAERVAEALQGAGPSLSVHNAGVPSSTTRDARDRFARDVLAHKPRVVVIQFGLNDAAVDVWRNPPATSPRVPLAEYEQNLRWIIAALRRHDAKPVLMTTNPLRWTPKLRELYGKPPYRPEDADGFDAPLLARYNETVRNLARQLAVPLVDVHAAFTTKGADKLLLDGMHPNDAGHKLITDLLVPVIREGLPPVSPFRPNCAQRN